MYCEMIITTVRSVNIYITSHHYLFSLSFFFCGENFKDLLSASFQVYTVVLFIIVTTLYVKFLALSYFIAGSLPVAQGIGCRASVV